MTRSEKYAFSTRGSERYSGVSFRAGDALLFGPETRGLPQEVLDALPDGIPLSLEVRSRALREAFPNATARAAHLLERTREFLANLEKSHD